MNSLGSLSWKGLHTLTLRIVITRYNAIPSAQYHGPYVAVYPYIRGIFYIMELAYVRVIAIQIKGPLLGYVQAL